MEIFRVLNEGPFRSPALVVALDGWVNAGDAATIVADTLGNGPLIVEFAVDPLVDYRQSRPSVVFAEGIIEDVEWPSLGVHLYSGTNRDLLVMSGFEPSRNWRWLSEATVEIAARLGVTEHISIGGLPWTAPHTRPVSLMMTSGSPDRIPPECRPLPGPIRVPAAATTILEHAMAEAGFPSIGFWAQVPNYVADPYPAAAIALLHRLGEHLRESITVDPLVDAASEQRIEIDRVVASDPNLQDLITEYEMVFDAGSSVSGESLAAEIEKFLRDDS